MKRKRNVCRRRHIRSAGGFGVSERMMRGFTRLIAMLLTLVLAISVFIPELVFAEALKHGKKTVTDVADPEVTEYNVEVGTALEDVGLPEKLSVTLRDPDTESSSMEEAVVTWTGTYDGNTGGEYVLSAAFVDETYTYDRMPTVKVAVNDTPREDVDNTSGEDVNDTSLEPNQDASTVDVSATASIGSHTWNEGEKITWTSSGAQVTFIVKCAGDPAYKNRKIEIAIPRGLMLLNATGVASVNGGSYTRQTYTPTEMYRWSNSATGEAIYPTWQQNGSISVTGTSQVINNDQSGVLTYYMSNAVSDAELYFRVKAHKDFVNDIDPNAVVETILKQLTITMSGEKEGGPLKKDTSAFDVSLLAPKQIQGVALSAPGRQYPNRSAWTVLKFNMTNPFSDESDKKGEFIAPEFDLTYETAAKFNVPGGWTVTDTTTDDAAGTTTVHLVQNDKTNVRWGVSNTTIFQTGIFYPEESFPPGSQPRVSVANISYKVFKYDSDTDSFSLEDCFCTRVSSAATTIIPLPSINDYAVWFYNQRADTEEYNDYTTARKQLFAAKRDINHKVLYQPIRLRIDCDTTYDNCTNIKMQSPLVHESEDEGARITKIVVKYAEDETEKILYSGSWYPTRGNYGPATHGRKQSIGGVLYSWQGRPVTGGWSAYGSAPPQLQLDAPQGKTFEYFYVEFDGDNEWDGHNWFITEGRPKEEKYTGIFSRYKFSSWYQDKSTGEWKLAAESVEHGFRWKKPQPIHMNVVPVDLGSETYQYDHSSRESWIELARCTIQNDSGTATPEGAGIKVSVNIDQQDYVRQINFPYCYNNNVNLAAEQVKSIKYSYVGDPEVYTWTKDSGAAAPFIKGARGGTIYADGNNVFAAFEVELDGWGTSTEVSSLQLYGYLRDHKLTGVKGKHTLTVEEIYDDGTTESLGSGTSGKLLVNPTNASVSPITENSERNAGSTGNIHFYVQGNNYTHDVIAVVLPTGITLNSMTASDLRINRGSTSQSLGRAPTMTPVSGRKLTPAEVTRIFGNDKTVDGATVYCYKLSNPYLYHFPRWDGGMGTSYYLEYSVNASITVNVLYPDAVYTMDKLVYAGTDLQGLGLNRLWNSNNVVSNTLGAGVSANLVTGYGSTRLKINKYPALIIQNKVANSSGDFQTYDGVNDSTATMFGPREKGTMRYTVSNTVKDETASAANSYVFLPIPNGKGAKSALCTLHEFDLTIDGVPVTSEVPEGVDLEVRYLRSDKKSIDVAEGESTFRGASATYTKDCNLLAVRVQNLKPGNHFVVDIPVVAPDFVTNTPKYNQMGAQSVFVFTSSSSATYSSSSTYAGNPMRVAYEYPEYDVSFSNIYVDDEGGIHTMTDPVTAGIKVRAKDPIYGIGLTPEEHMHALTQPVLPGYRFSGWYTDKECSTAFVPYNGKDNLEAATKITENRMLYAKWTKMDITLTKTVGGDYGDKIAGTEFTVAVKHKDGKPVEEGTTFAYTGSAIAGVAAPEEGTLTADSGGQMKILLKHGQSVKFTNMEEDAIITVSEKTENGTGTIVLVDRRKVAAQPDSGDISLDGIDKTIEFQDSRDIVPTGTDLGTKIIGKRVLIAVACTMLMAVILLWGAFLRKKGKNASGRIFK